MICVNYVEDPDYFLIILRGDFDLQGITALLPELLERALRSRSCRVLVDAYKLSAPREEADRFRLGEKIAEAVRGRFKVAVLSRFEHINKFMEDTAVNRGATIFVTNDKDEALEWLLGGHVPSELRYRR
ncbi:MAG: STAS/SEC14 domain-containing protein [Deltaproteobacteria bacterium]|nr:STAS/SEC14 domain-containing protein [Deltaproteobacteria bacterium]